MDFGFDNLVADWNGVDRPIVNELSERKSPHQGGKKMLTQQAEPSKKKRRNLPLVSLHRIRGILGQALFIRSPVSNQFRMSGICDPCHRGCIRFVLLEQTVYIDCTAAAFLSTKLFILSGPRYNNILVDKVDASTNNFSIHGPTRSRPCKAVPPSRNMV